MAKLAAIEGIGKKYANKLSKTGVGSLESLLKQGSTKKGRKGLASETKISEKLILAWVNRADLARIKGVGTQYGDLLEASGVDSVPALARRKAENLVKKMVEVNTKKKLVRQPPGLAQVKNWIGQAGDLPKVVKH